MRALLSTFVKLALMLVLFLALLAAGLAAAPAPEPSARLAFEDPTTHVLPPWAQLSSLGGDQSTLTTPRSPRSATNQADPDPLSKVEALVLEQLSVTNQTDFFIWMKEKADLSPAYELEKKEEKGQFVFEILHRTAERTQKQVRAYLDRQGVDYQHFYVANKILVRGGHQTLLIDVASRPDVARITANHRYQLEEPVITPNRPARVLAVEPNIRFVNADDVWAMGHTGEGTVLAGNDTGLDWDHPALINQYRGWDGVTVDHNHNWWDATDTYPTGPNDGDGHGTHTSGTMVGDDGGGNRVGMAPGARLVHCKNLDNSGGGTDAAATECFEWDLAPWDLDGLNPRPDMAPDAVNISWGYWGGGSSAFEDEIAALRAAGIVVVVSAGNEGPSCGTLSSPGDYGQSCTIGSVSHSGGSLPGTISPFSSRGPSSLYPADYIPDVMAPGEEVRSSVPGGGYQGGWSGTSMAAPHVTGLVGLIWSANPGLRGMVKETVEIIRDTAMPLTGQSGSGCGGDYVEGPNNDWGHGTIDSLAAVEQAMHSGGSGNLVGTVTDGVDPVPYAIIEASLTPTMTWRTISGPSGHYSMAVFSGTYTVDAYAYGYLPTQFAGVSVTSGTTTTLDIALTLADYYTVSGTITDTATGWPLYASIEVDGYPGDPVWSDPVTGYYSVTLAGGITYTFRVNAWVEGYDAASRDVGPLMGNETHGFGLQADLGACSAPGYDLSSTLLFSESFDSGIAGSWTVVDNMGNGCVWRDDDPGGVGNLTGGSGGFAIADSDECDPMDTELRTPALDAIGYTGLRIEYKNDYNDLYSTAQVDVYDGDVWTTIDDISGVDHRGPETRTIDTLAGAGFANAKVRWHYIAGWDWWWEVDEIRIYGTTCTPQPGGIVVGNVYDERTGDPLIGAEVTNEDGFRATTEATLDDSVLDDGFYTIFSPQGSKTFTSTMANYGADVDPVTVPQGNTIQHDFYLPAGWLSPTPATLEATLDMGLTTTLPLTVSNLGGVPVAFEFMEVDQGFEPTRLSRVKISGYQAPELGIGESASTYAGERLVSRETWSYRPSEEAYARSLSVNVLLVAAGDAAQIQAMLQAYPDINTVDTFDASMSTPNLDDLLAYDTLIVTSNAPFADPVAVGNVLADYIDAGGTVVQAVATFYDVGEGWALQGRFVDEGYSPFIGTGDWYMWAELGDFNPTHPIMQGVAAVGDHLRQVVDLAAESDLVAEWTDDEFVATKGSVVALNTFLCDGYGWTGDVDLIVHNSVIWLQGSGEVDWLSEDPITATVGIADQRLVSVTFDGRADSVEQPGRYRGLLMLNNDSPYDAPEIPVTMTVNAPATWGKLEGTVTGLGYCDAVPAPLEGAEVLVESWMTKTITVTYPITITLEDFEADDGGYVISGTTSWAWGTPSSGPGAAHSGSHLWATNLSGDYDDDEDGSIESPDIDLSEYAGQGVELTWWQYYDGENCCDRISVEISDDGGDTWSTPVYGPFHGGEVNEQVWERQVVTLGPSYMVDDFRVRFHFTSDYSITYPGWYVDDVSIMGYSEAQVDVPVSWQLESDENGHYERWINEARSPLTVTVTYPNHETGQVASVSVIGQTTTTHDYSLRWLQPCVGVAPLSMDVSLASGCSTTMPLTLTNSGAASTAFEFDERDGDIRPLLAVPQVGAQVVVVGEDKHKAPESAGVKSTSSGGPDAYGYTFIDSDEPGGPDFDWLEIAPPAGGSGTPAGLSGIDDGHVFPIPISFPFNFYGVDYMDLALASNGTVYFEDDYLGYVNAPIPSINGYGIRTFIAHFWDDLVVDGEVYYQDFGDMFVVEYYNVRLYSGNNLGTWEVILYDNGNILTQYLDTAVSDGSGATFGIQGDETTGLQYSYNAPAVTNGLAICFIYPGAPLCGEGEDIPWLSADPTTGTVGADSTFMVDVTFDTMTYTLGTYTGTLVIDTDDVVNDRINVPVTMTISHGLTCGFESSSPDDLGETTIFTNTTTGATPLTYSWDFGDRSEISSAENPTHTYAHVGFYTVVLTATNPCGTNVCSDAVSIEGVEGGFVSNSPVDLGDPMVFTNTTLSNPPIGQYYWTFGDGEDSEDENPVHLYAAPGTYTVTLYAVDVLYGPSSVYDIYQETVQVLAPPTLEPRSYLPLILRDY